MHVIRHGDVHGVNVAGLLGEQFAPVGVLPRAGHLLGGFRKVIFIHVAERDDFQTRMRLEGWQIHAAHAAHADAGMAQFAVGRNAPGGGGGGGAAGHQSEAAQGGQGEKFFARDFIFHGEVRLCGQKTRFKNVVMDQSMGDTRCSPVAK